MLVGDYGLNIMEGEGIVSRECRMHSLMLKNIPEIGAVIHAHPEYTMVYVSACKPIPSVTEATQKMGDCQLIEQAKAYSQDLADHVYDYFKDKRELLTRTGLCALLPLHGTVAVGKHLEQAFSVVERIECDAKCNIFRKMI
ncbi:MAG: class II aldolase/adducin family protein [Clostridia bacterium]|nr:class II aldolase/adducin family protein [Clostridia bacterium]